MGYTTFFLPMQPVRNTLASCCQVSDSPTNATPGGFKADAMTEVAHFLGDIGDDDVHQQVTRKRLAANLENPLLSDLGDNGANGSCTAVAVSLVKFSPWLRRQKSIAAANLHQLLDEGTQHIDQVIWRIPMMRVYFQGAQETGNSLGELALPQVQKAQVAMSRGIPWADLQPALQLYDGSVEPPGAE
jgi:hypothetical protein